MKKIDTNPENTCYLQNMLGPSCINMEEDPIVQPGEEKSVKHEKSNNMTKENHCNHDSSYIVRHHIYFVLLFEN